jgi:predicted Zn-dependent protease
MVPFGFEVPNRTRERGDKNLKPTARVAKVCMIEHRPPTKAWRMAPAGRALAFATAVAVAAAGGGPSFQPARAQERVTSGLPIIRDTEIENLLRDYAMPILKAAGLAQQNVRVVILNDSTFNAFVMDGHHIFINSGALFEAKTPNEIIGVFAHETGHLAGGHLMKLREKLAQAQTASIVALLAGVGAAVAGARSGSGGNIGVPAIMAPQSAIQHSLLAYVRTQEDQADHAGVKFLTATHQSARGMLELFKRLSNEMLFGLSKADPYLQTHPLPPERVAALEVLAKASPYFDRKDPPELQLRHDMMRAKLSGFLDRPDTVFRLIQAEPNNPYFYELKGQALLEGGRPSDAIAPLRHAVTLAHGAPLIDIMLGQALIATDNKKYAEEAVPLLRNALAREPEAPEAYAQLAMAYGRKGDLAQADLAAAQAAFNRGDLMTARQLASRAKTRLPVGSPAWVQADDIVSVKPSKANK